MRSFPRFVSANSLDNRFTEISARGGPTDDRFGTDISAKANGWRDDETHRRSTPEELEARTEGEQM